MKLKLLLFTLLLMSGIMSAQQANRSLMITEVRFDRADQSYVEITNMGNMPIDLSEFEFGVISAWTVHYEAEEGNWMMLPEVILMPGESYVIASVLDFVEEQYALDYAKMEYSLDFQDHITKPEMWKLADLQVHHAEEHGDETDSVSNNDGTMVVWGQGECWYLRHHLFEDSIVVDQVGGVWDEADETNYGRAYNVAGVTNATRNCVLIRKFAYKLGNTNFADARGLDIEDSEWIPIPLLAGNWDPDRAVFWTVGNHGDYVINEATLISETVDVNLVDSILTVPWGIRRDDSIMYQFNRTPGLAWHYDYVPSHEDSAYVSIRTGDTLTVYACGIDRDMVKFHINVLAPTADANIVIPKRAKNEDGFYNDSYIPYIVTDKVPGMDTISEVPFATRTDTLLKYLEKAPKATWEFIWVDDTVRTDLKRGDILRVTAEDGLSVKDYFIKVQYYRDSRNAYLSSITWPDIPEFYYDFYGWIGDTIPNFTRVKLDYKVQVPWDVEGIPALVGKTDDVNASVKIDRAKNLAGSVSDRTITFTSTAENDSTQLIYKVQLEKQKDIANVQPWAGEPFISEFTFWEQYQNGYIEVCNPGTEPLDLSWYMFYGQWASTPAEAIESYSGEDDWMNRFIKYVPGYKWVDSASWRQEPAILVQDAAVNPMVQPGDVFVMGYIDATGDAYAYYGKELHNWFVEDQLDVLFYHSDPDKQGIVTWSEPSSSEVVCHQWTGANIHMFKILNDSVRQGKKPANDPNDFLLLETWGNGEGEPWVVGGVEIPMVTSAVRKPEFFQPKPGYNESFGTTPENSEWKLIDQDYLKSIKYPWPEWRLLIVEGLGSHFMNEVTIYKSTVASLTYKVSEGYSMEEEIRGVVTGTSVTNFLTNILKVDTGQNLTLVSSSNGDTLTVDDILMDGDTLIVVSNDKTNTSKYILDVTDIGLSNNALLTSTLYTIDVADSTGTITNIEYGTKLATVVDNVTLPPYATSFTIIDKNGAYMPLKILNFDTALVDVGVSDQIYFEVVAEDGVTKITYQLKPNATSSDAFVTSDIFTVNQEEAFIDFIPLGTTVQAFIKNLVPAPGATLKLVDKIGLERTFGDLVKDDKLIVTSQNGDVIKVYYLSMLQTYEGETYYLAYVLSDVYTVNQITLSISDASITEATSVTTFLANLVPAPGATIKVVNANDVENTGPTLNIGDFLKVTALNGVTTAYYSIVGITSTNELSNSSIYLYPNPSSGTITVAGLEPGNRIRIYNILGIGLRDMVAYQNEEVISLDGQPVGVYFVVITNDDSIVGHYKLIIK